jgi:hypothetical protein
MRLTADCCGRREIRGIRANRRRVDNGEMRDMIHTSKNGRSTATLEGVASRFHREVGLPKSLSRRLSKKFNKLAKKVDWAVPLPERDIPAYAYTKRSKAPLKGG